jgi:hypothetical protein
MSPEPDFLTLSQGSQRMAPTPDRTCIVVGTPAAYCVSPCDLTPFPDVDARHLRARHLGERNGFSLQFVAACDPVTAVRSGDTPPG